LFENQKLVCFFQIEDCFMKKIQILGTGCPKCKKLAQNAEEAAKQLGIEYQLEKIADINRIISFGVMAMPAIAVDGKVKLVGKVASTEEIKRLLS
jgi:small redox-active disulfide protein 2